MTYLSEERKLPGMEDYHVDLPFPFARTREPTSTDSTPPVPDTRAKHPCHRRVRQGWEAQCDGAACYSQVPVRETSPQYHLVTLKVSIWLKLVRLLTLNG